MKPQIDKAVIYCRQACIEQVDDKRLKEQEERLKNYALRNNLTVVKMFPGHRINSHTRRDTNMLLAYLKVSQSHHLVCSRFDRLARNLLDTANLMDWLCSDSRNRIHLIDSNIVLDKDSNHLNIFSFNMSTVKLNCELKIQNK